MVFRMCFVLFRVLQHDIRRKSPKRMCYHWFLLTNTFCINTMAACNLLRSFKFQKGQGSAVMSIYVYFVSFRIVFRIFFYFFVFVNFISFFRKSFRILFRICTHDRQNEQLTWTLSRILYFVWFFSCIAYVFRIVSYVVLILSCQES